MYYTLYILHLFNMFLFNVVLFQKMSSYNHCLFSVVLNGAYKTDDLPHTIQDDVAVLQAFKNKIHEWNAIDERITQIQ